jgi:hypothetical protein
VLIIFTEEMIYVHELLIFLCPGRTVLIFLCSFNDMVDVNMSFISEVFHCCGIGGIDHISPD